MAEETVSLYTLMENHLSSLNISDTAANSGDPQNPPPDAPKSDGSDPPDPLAQFRCQNTINIPQFLPENKAIKDLLSGQISNMLKAKEKLKQEEEEKKLAEEMKLLQLKEEIENVIDLTPAIIKKEELVEEPKIEVVEEKPTVKPQVKKNNKKVPLRFKKELHDWSNWDPTAPCSMDLSNLLKKKIKRGKPSMLARVLCARPKKMYFPHIKEPPQTTITPFDFSTKSPCDEYLENIRKPKMHNPFTVNIMDLDWI